MNNQNRPIRPNRPVQQRPGSQGRPPQRMNMAQKRPGVSQQMSNVPNRMQRRPGQPRHSKPEPPGKRQQYLIVVAVLVAIVIAVSVIIALIANRAEEPGDTTGIPTVTGSTASAADTAEGTASAPDTTVPVTAPPETTTVDPADFPDPDSQNGRFYDYPGTNQFRVGNYAYDICGYSAGTANQYANLVSKVADDLAGETKVYSLIIPTAYGITLPDDIRAQFGAGYVDQSVSMNDVFSKMSANVIPVNCYNNMMAHRDEYLYFRTDHHWNGDGAYYAYESFCNVKGVAPYTMEQRGKLTFDGFLGTLYSGNGNDQNLMPADTVNAYKPMSQTATMVYYDNAGNGRNWPILSDVSSWNSGQKYSTFAGGDQPLTVFTNPEVKDGSVAIVIKESFGNALLPFFVDHYSTIYEIDYRYWTGNLTQFAKEKNADDIIFANNIMMVSTNLLVGKLSGIVN